MASCSSNIQNPQIKTQKKAAGENNKTPTITEQGESGSTEEASNISNVENEGSQKMVANGSDDGSQEIAREDSLQEDDTVLIPIDISGSSNTAHYNCWNQMKVISATTQGEAEFHMMQNWPFTLKNNSDFTIISTETPFIVGLFVGEMTTIMQNREFSRKYQGIDNSSWKVTFKKADKTIKTVLAKEMYKAPDDSDFHIIFKTDLSPIHVEETLVEVSVIYNNEPVSAVYHYGRCQ